MTASWPSISVAPAAHCGGPLATNQHRPTPSCPTTPHSQGPFKHVRYPTCTAGTEPLYPANRLQILRVQNWSQISWMLEGHQKWLLTQCLRGRACTSPAMHSLRQKDYKSIAYRPILLRRPTLSPFSTLLCSTYRLYRLSSQEDSASPPQTWRRLLGRLELGLRRLVLVGRGWGVRCRGR